MNKITVKEIQDALQEYHSYYPDLHSYNGLPDVPFKRTLEWITASTHNYYVAVVSQYAGYLEYKFKEAQKQHITAFIDNHNIEDYYKCVCYYNRLLRELRDKVTRMFEGPNAAFADIGGGVPLLGLQVWRALEMYQNCDLDKHPIEWGSSIILICAAAKHVLFGL